MFEELAKDKTHREFFKKVILDNTQIDASDCWLWKRAKRTPFGYGSYAKRFGKKVFNISTHRLSWIAFNGEIPKDKIVCHKCDNASCCNPNHLWIGTHKENTKDMIEKGRDPFNFVGEKNNGAILTKNIVLKIREMKKNGEKIKDIAKHFNIKYFTCLDVINRRNWNHI